jgi:large subunit ribosomal protein L12
MEAIYGALLLHAAGKKVDEHSLTKVLEAAGAKHDQATVKAVVSSLEGVDIDEAIKQAAVTSAPVAAAPEAKAEKKEEKKEEDTAKKAEEAASGLSSLFG